MLVNNICAGAADVSLLPQRPSSNNPRKEIAQSLIFHRDRETQRPASPILELLHCGGGADGMAEITVVCDLDH
jgi:hypothetical protein